MSCVCETGLVAGGINNQVFTKLPYLLPGLIMFIIVICMDIMAILMFLHEVRDEGANEVSGRTRSRDETSLDD